MANSEQRQTRVRAVCGQCQEAIYEMCAFLQTCRRLQGAPAGITGRIAGAWEKVWLEGWKIDARV